MSRSPPNPPPISIPMKRPSLSAASSGSVKRRKASEASASPSPHPLRNASFPPAEQTASFRQASFSPTDTGSATGIGSVTGSNTSAGGKKRGRRSAVDGRSINGGSQSAVNADATSTVLDGRGSVAGSRGAERDEEDADDEEVDGLLDTVLEGNDLMNNRDKEIEQKNLDMLLSAMNADQNERYSVWRRVRLKKETVRRITNQTLSQSVPQSIVTTINGYTKLFIGELIERARDVQNEWLAASRNIPTVELKAIKQRNGRISSSQTNQAGNKVDGSTPSLPNVSENSDGSVVMERDRGPLLPDHLREALRRYKYDRDGAGAGFQGVSQHAKQRVASRVAGKRLFR